MKKRKVAVIIAIIAALAVPFSVFAATSDVPAAKSIRGFFGLDSSNLTEQQKADVTDFTKKMADLQKDFINKMVENGAITKEQGDTAIQQMDDKLANGGAGTLLPGFGMGKGIRDAKGGFGLGQIDTSKLTDEQKAGLTDSFKKMADLQKDLIHKMIASALITQAQGDTATQKIDEIFNNLTADGFSKGMGMMIGGFGGFNCFGFMGVDSSKLTDQQKADFEDFSAKMAELQKELINKLVTYGLITSEQGDAFINRTQNIDKFRQEGGSMNGMGMRKGFSGNRGRQGGFNSNSTSGAAM